MKRNLLHRWPELAPFVSAEGLLYIDLAVAEMILRGYSNTSLSLIALLCKLSAAARCGHLCLDVEDSTSHVSFSDLVEDPIIAQKLDELCEGSYKELSLFLENKEENKIGPVLLCNGRLYLQKNAFFEESVAFHIKRLLSSSTSCCMPIEKDYFALNPQQAIALHNALTYPFSLITGGPGTGKTFTSAAIVKAFAETRQKDKKEKIVICLAAPTGRAAAHLEKNVVAHVKQSGCIIRSGTLHSLLSIRSEKDMMREHPLPFAADLIIVDECSMIDAKLLCHFLSSVSCRTTLVLMGDKDQLPPVESGSLFADLIDAAAKAADIPLTRLTQCLRSDRKDILDFARAVNESHLIKIQQMLQKDSSGLKRIHFGMEDAQHKAALSSLWRFCKNYFSFDNVESLAPKDLLKKFDQFRMLSCMRKGPYGVDAINGFFLERSMEQVQEGQMLALPIMITKNDYALQLFNGDVGVLLVKAAKGRFCPLKSDIAYFHDRGGEGIRELAALTLPQFSFAFALSVHKSQGSEYGSILLLAPRGSERFGKEMLYTAVTRAKDTVYLDVADDILPVMALRCARKISGLHARLQ